MPQTGTPGLRDARSTSMDVDLTGRGKPATLSRLFVLGMSSRKSLLPEEGLMRQLVFLFLTVLAAESAALAQNELGPTQGVHAPPQSSTGNLRGVFAPPQSAFPTRPVYGTPVPSLSLPSAQVGDLLPEGVNASPMPDRPGYGRATINGRPAIIDMGSNRIVQYSD